MKRDSKSLTTNRCPKCKSENMRLLYEDGPFDDTDVFECLDCKQHFLRRQCEKKKAN